MVCSSDDMQVNRQEALQVISQVNVLEKQKELSKEGFLDFFTCTVLCGALEGIPTGDLDGELAGQSTGELDGMLGTRLWHLEAWN